MPHIDGMSQESLVKFLDGMRIIDVAFYGNPEAMHLFLASRSAAGVNALLTMTACDDTLSIDLQGTSDDGGRPLLEEDLCETGQ